MFVHNETWRRKFILVGIFCFFIFLISLPVRAQVEAEIQAIAWSPNGSLIAVGYTDGKVAVVDHSTSVQIQSWEEHTDKVTSIAWSPNGDRLVSGSYDNTLRIWDIAQENSIATLTDQYMSDVLAVGWSPDNTMIIDFEFSSQSVRTWDAQTYFPLSTYYESTAWTVTWSPNGSEIFLGNAGGGIAVRDAASFEDIYFTGDYIINNEAGQYYGIFATAWSSDGNLIAGGNLAGITIVWEASDGDFLSAFDANDLQTLGVETSMIHAIRFFANDTAISSIRADGVVRTWNIATGEIIDTTQLNTSISSAAWSPDGNWIAYGDGDTLHVVASPQVNPITCDHNIPASDTATLISTITTANGSGNPTTICLAQDSTYTITTANNYLNALPYITGDITIEGNNSTITRSGTENFRFFEVETGGKLTLNDLTLSNGDVTGENERGGALMNDGGETTLNNVTFDGNVGVTGGAIDNEEGTLTINDSTFTNNGGAYGGAIDNDATATMTITGSSFTTNQALFDGGAIHNDGGTLTVSSTTFTTNTAEDYGGAIDNDDGDLTINASTFTSNSSDGGGAIRNDSAITLTINAGTTFNNNSANNLGWGGAIYNKSGTTLIINGTSFSGNTANLEGGAIRNQGSLTVNSASTFDGNTAAEYGGAIYNTSGTVNLTGVQVTNNTATAKDAGGVYGNSSSSLTITDSTLSGNDSGRRGGGIWSSGTASFTNVYVTNNTAVVEGGGIYGSSSATISAGNSCITGNTSRAAYSASSSNQIFENNWWGATNGPSGSGSGSGDAVNSKIDYTPFINTSCPLP